MVGDNRKKSQTGAHEAQSFGTYYQFQDYTKHSKICGVKKGKTDKPFAVVTPRIRGYKLLLKLRP